MTEKKYAVLSVDRLPYGLFKDMDSAKDYIESHDRLNSDNASIIWPVPMIQEGSDE